MKRLSLLFALSIVLLSFGLADATKLDFGVSLEAGKTFTHPDPPNGTYVMGNTNLYIGIQMSNVTGTEYLTGWAMGLEVYSNPGGATVIWTDVGEDPIASIERLNEFEVGGIWEGMNTLTAANWDGALPDNFRHDCLGAFTSTGGFRPDMNTLIDRFRLHLSVPVAGHDQSTDVVQICVDEFAADWLFPDPEDFGGPYCFDFLGVPDLPPEVNGTPMGLTTEHDVAFSGSYSVTDAEGGTITGVGAIDESDNPIGTATLVGGAGGTGTLNWTFDPPCSWVTDGMSHTVRFYAEESGAGHAYPTVKLSDPVSLTVTNTAPEIVGPCPRPGEYTAALEEPFTHNFDATDPNAFGESQTWHVSTAGAPVGPYAVDPTGLFSFTPDATDDGFTYVFDVVVEDCAGAMSAACQITIKCSSLFPFGIAIEYEDGNTPEEGVDGLGHYLGTHAYVDVYKVDGTEKMLGFDFMVSYDNSALAALGAYPNPMLFKDDGHLGCEWEYFTYRFVNNCGGSCPSGMLQFVAIADQNDGVPFSDEDCFWVDGTPEEPFTLFTIDFFISNDYTLECSFVPISFFWTDCSDNSIAFSYNGVLNDFPFCVKQAISLGVFSPDGSALPEFVAPFNGFREITDTDYGFPGGYGAYYDECNPNTEWGGSDAFNCEDVEGKEPITFINFFNGGIKIICSDAIDARGDINLNGVLNEIADAVVFTNYFIYGMSAFTINPEGQKAATDVNADGIPLSVADLVYLIRVVIGDVLPIDKLNPNMVEANFGYDGQLVTVDVELGAALFVLEGNVEVNLAQDASHMMIKSDVVNGNTRALVYSFDKDAVFSGNILNTDGKMIAVEAVDYNGSTYKTVVLPTTFSVQNYPNPFNPATTIEMALPVATNWNLTIYNVAGQKVAEFAGFAEAGINNVVWDASASASGIYFYKVTTDEGSMTKKMVLLK